MSGNNYTTWNIMSKPCPAPSYPSDIGDKGRGLTKLTLWSENNLKPEYWLPLRPSMTFWSLKERWTTPSRKLEKGLKVERSEQGLLVLAGSCAQWVAEELDKGPSPGLERERNMADKTHTFVSHLALPLKAGNNSHHFQIYMWNIVVKLLLYRAAEKNIDY